MIKFIKTLFNIVKYHESDKDILTGHIHNLYKISSDAKDRSELAIKTATEAVNIIKERTEINASISVSGYDGNKIFVMGRYNNVDYVEVYSIRDKDFSYMVGILREMQKFGHINKIDGPSGMKQSIKQNLNY